MLDIKMLRENPEALRHALARRNADGLWQRVVSLRWGGYHYKFLVDGEWILDPQAQREKVNSYGRRDSYIEVNGTR